MWAPVATAERWHLLAAIALVHVGDLPMQWDYTSQVMQIVGSLRLRSMRAKRRSESQSGIASIDTDGFVNRRWNTKIRF